MAATLKLTPDDLNKLRRALPTLPEGEKRRVAELLKVYGAEKIKEVGKTSLLSFIKHVYPGYIVGPHHYRLAKIFEDIAAGKKKRVIVNIAPRHGKECAHSTSVLTTKGWTTHGELRVGDEVFHPSGVPVRVVALSEETTATMEVETTTGEVIKCHENHEWLIRDAITHTEKVVETKWFLANSVTGPRAGQPKKLWLGKERGQRGGRCHYQLPFIQTLQFPEQALQVDPYSLGIWLGDGTQGDSLFCMSSEDMDQVLPAVAGYYPLARRYAHQTTGVHYARLTLPFKYALKKLGVLDSKHIPEIYLRSSVSQRLALLAGLVDTDGHVEKGTGRVRIVTCDVALRDGIYDLCMTLGFAPYVTEQAPCMSSSGIQGRKVTYTVGFQPTCVLPTKVKRKQLFMHAVPRRVGIADVRQTARPEKGRCIQVDSPDGLYLVGKTLIPTHNSEMISYLAPAWFLGNFPQKKVIMASHTADLAVDFGRRVRNLVGSDRYHDIFPQVELQADSKSASRWGTNFNGEYFAIGVGGALAGRGADLFVIDDPHSEQEAKQMRPEVFKPAWEWFQSGPLQRLMPGGAIIVVMTRWSRLDLTGQIIDHMTRNDDSAQWEIVEFPAILDDKPLWPEFWSLEELLSKKADMDPRYWQSQYMQDPTSEEGALIKREWWQIWDKESPPQCEFLIMSLDAAQETNNRADFNALLTWGVFFNEQTKQHNIILLNAIKERLEFPDLKELVLNEYNEWEPDALIVEKKSNGAALYQELRRMGIPVGEFTPGKGQDKISRVNAVADMFSSGMVWAPDRRWAREVIEECNDFPSGRNDDQVDATTLALARFRQGGFIRLPSDEPEPQKFFKSYRRGGYY